MADRTGIEWADATLNPIRARNRETGQVGFHCEHATPGCEHCYAEGINKRLGTGLAFTRQNRDRVALYFDAAIAERPFGWRRPRSIFWNSMTDGAAEFVEPEWVQKIAAVAALTPRHRHIFLTKRGDRLLDLFGSDDMIDRVAHLCEVARKVDGTWNGLGPLGHLEPGARWWPLPNLFLGVSVEDQRRAHERRAGLAALADAGWATFVSYEPALGPVDWSGWEFLRWLIAGGESGPHARWCDPAWIRLARDFCGTSGIPFFFKQWGEWFPAEMIRTGDDGEVWRRDPDGEERWSIEECSLGLAAGADPVVYDKLGKKAAGRLLDGREWSEVPA